MMPTQTQKEEKVPLSTLEVGDHFRFHNGGELYVLLDMKFFDENRDNIWAYADAETEAYEGMVRDGNNPDHFDEMVYLHETN